MHSCARCGTPLPVHKGRHRPRKFCTTCRPPQQRKPLDEAPTVAEIRPGVSTEGVSLVAATGQRLASAGRLGTAEAVLVLALAQSIDDGGHSGASLASLSREYSRALLAAVAEAKEQAEADGVAWDVG